MKNTIILILLTVLSFDVFGQSNSVEIWMRAFIPNPQNAGGGTGFISPNQTGGSIVSLHNLNQSIPNICFATDDRGFSNNPIASSRLETKFTITLNEDGTGKIFPLQNRTIAAITKKIDCTTGEVIEQKAGSVDRDNLGNPAVADGTVQVIGQIQGRNLLTPLGSIGPSIDYSFDIQWKPSTSTLIATITIGSFPAFEMYARQPNGKWIKIIQQLPTGTPWQLGADAFGINSFSLVETKIITGISGKWQSPAPEQRFTLEFKGKKINWTEKNQSGVNLTKEVNVIELTDGKFKIERPNTDEVLTFLGFQQSIRAEILARSPQPSFIILSRNNEKITAEWNGLIATKDANAHLNELIQPGVRLPKIFELSEIQ